MSVVCSGRSSSFTTCCPRPRWRPGPLCCGATRRSWASAGERSPWCLAALWGASAAGWGIWLWGETRFVPGGAGGSLLFQDGNFASIIELTPAESTSGFSAVALALTLLPWTKHPLTSSTSKLGFLSCLTSVIFRTELWLPAQPEHTFLKPFPKKTHVDFFLQPPEEEDETAPEEDQEWNFEHQGWWSLWAVHSSHKHPLLLLQWNPQDPGKHLWDVCPSGEELLASQKGIAIIIWNVAGIGFVASVTSVLVASLIPHKLCGLIGRSCNRTEQIQVWIWGVKFLGFLCLSVGSSSSAGLWAALKFFSLPRILKPWLQTCWPELWRQWKVVELWWFCWELWTPWSSSIQWPWYVHHNGSVLYQQLPGGDAEWGFIDLLLLLSSFHHLSCFFIQLWWDLLHSGISEMLQMWVLLNKVRILSGMCCGWKWRQE